MTRNRLLLLLGAPLVLVALVLGGTWVYVHVIEGDAPNRLTLANTSAPPASGPAATGPVTPVDGTWRATGDSVVGYRVNEVLFGQSATAVGRTSRVTGSITVAGKTVSGTTFSVDMASVASDQSRRDGQYRNRIMETSTYPTATFEQTAAVTLSAVPADGATVTATATGRLTLHGQTKTVTFDVRARRSGARIEVNGTIPVVFSDWGIPSPSFGPAQVEDHGDLEFLLVFAK
jgi:polyisoprenoid-binding protein YceI